MYSHFQEPSCDPWREYELPERCQYRIEEICKDILKRGEQTRYKTLYTVIYEIVEADINIEHQKEY